MIGQKFNFDEVFFRDLTVCVLDTLEGRLNWINRFSSGNVPVNVPIYYSMTGDDRFLLDSFQDDIVSENRYVELNTDQIPRGHLTLTNFNIRSDEFRNPNVWLRTVIEDDVEVKKLLKKVRAIPITVTYDLTIILKNEIDIFKCAQEIMNTLWLYRFMYFEHNYLHIDAVMLMPDTETIQIQREKNLKSDDTVRLTATIEVQTYYPAFVNSNQEKFRATVSKAQPGAVVELNSVVGISIGQQVIGSSITYNVTVLSINYELNFIVLSVIDIDLILNQVISFVNVDNTGLPIIQGDSSKIDPVENLIYINNTYNYIYNQPISIGGNTYTVVNGTNIINLITVKDVQVGQQVTGPNLPNSVKVLEVIEQSNQVVVSRSVSVSSGQPLFFAFDSNISDASVPFKTRWFGNLYVNKFQNRVSSNAFASTNWQGFNKPNK
jgi:hypothetical protein